MEFISHITDPIHGSISLNSLEMEIIDTYIFQRLRWVQQLSGAHLVYPDATHTRFSHSLGAMHISNLYATKHFSNKKTIQHIRLAAMLHDIGHGPYSHVFDSCVYKTIYPNVEKGHDEHRYKILEYLSTKYDIFSRYNIDISYISDIWSGKCKIEHDIVQGKLGGDRLDYMLRDSYHSGISLSFSLNRIINFSSILKIANTNNSNLNSLIYHPKLNDEINMIMYTRDMLYKKIYKHKKSEDIFNKLQKMIEYCKDELCLVERVMDIDKFILLNDTTILGEIMTLRYDHPSKILALEYMFRKN